MFAKLVVVILTIGACACMLLSVRQARLQAAHELARAQLRVHECDDRLWAVRAEIGRRVMPERVRQMADALGSFRPMLPLPGDVDRRTMYAQNNPPDFQDELPHPEMKPVPPVRAPSADIRTVSQVQKPPAKKADSSKSKATKPKDAKPGSKPSRHATAIQREPRP